MPKNRNLPPMYRRVIKTMNKFNLYESSVTFAYHGEVYKLFFERLTDCRLRVSEYVDYVQEEVFETQYKVFKELKCE